MSRLSAFIASGRLRTIFITPSSTVLITNDIGFLRDLGSSLLRRWFRKPSIRATTFRLASRNHRALHILGHQIPDISRAAAQNGLGGIERGAESLLDPDEGRHDQFHAAGDDVEQRGTGLGQPILYRGLEIAGALDPP